MFNIFNEHFIYVNVKAKANTTRGKCSKDKLVSQKR